MTALPDFHVLDAPVLRQLRGSDAAAAPMAAGFEMQETYWGYVLRSREAAPLGVLALQGLCWAFGTVFVMAALGLWAVPMPIVTGSVIGFKLATTILCAAMAWFLMWFASRGVRSEIHVDTALGEVREVVNNRVGRPTLVGRHGFDAICGVTLQQGAACADLPAGHARLVLMRRDTSDVLSVARGPAQLLRVLHDRLGQDLMVRARSLTRVPLASLPEALLR